MGAGTAADGVRFDSLNLPHTVRGENGRVKIVRSYENR